MGMKQFISIWGGISVLLELAGNEILKMFLRRNNVPLKWPHRRNPSYLIRQYRAWCKENNRSSKFISTLLIVSLLNVIISGIAFILVVAQ